MRDWFPSELECQRSPSSLALELRRETLAVILPGGNNKGSEDKPIKAAATAPAGPTGTAQRNRRFLTQGGTKSRGEIVMLDLIHDRPRRHPCGGPSRRAFLQAGSLSLAGLALPDLLQARAAAAAAGSPLRDLSIVLLFLDGGASQFETFDPKMGAPQEYRCLFGSTPTRLPGVEFCSLLPRLAGLADRMGIVKSFTHRDGDHGGATHWVKTGSPWPPEFLGKAPIIPQQTPAIGAVVARALGPVNRQTGVPTYVRVLSNHGGYPGDDAVWLGQEYNPFRVHAAPGGRSNPMLANMGLKVAPDRMADRQALLRSLDGLDRTLDKSGLMNGMDGFQQQAIDVLLGKAKEAFDLSREPDRLRDQYGPGLGQELLLARRLCEAGAGFVTLNHGYWDHHGGIIPGCKQLCPALDHAAATFVDDVRERGLEKNILFVITSEFGRTPRVGNYGKEKDAGRDHWAGLGPLVFMGGGLKMGQVIGESDDRGGYPKSRPVSPQDFMATVFQALGLDLQLQYVHPSGRPVSMIDDGRPLEELF